MYRYNSLALMYLIIVTISATFARIALMLNQTNAEKHFILKTVENWTNKVDVLTIIYNDDYKLHLCRPLNNVAVILNTNYPILSKNNILKYFYNFIILTNCNRLEVTLKYIRNSYLWNYGSTIRGKYFVFLFDCVNIKKSFGDIWNTKNVQEAVVFVRQGYKWLSYSYNPLTEESKCGKAIKPTLITDRQAIQLKSGTSLKYCHYNISKISYFLPPSYFSYGDETPILFGTMWLLRERYGLNVSQFDMSLIDQLGIAKQGYAGFKELLNEEYDAVAANVFRQDNLHIIDSKICELTDVFFFDDHIWYIPATKQIPAIKLLFVIFSEDVLFATCLSTVIAFIFWYLVTIVKREDKHVIELLGCIFGFAIKIPKSRIFKFLFIFYMIYGQHINYFFQGNLSSKLTIPQYERRIKTVEQLIKSNLIIFLPEYERELIANSTSPIISKLYKRSVPIVELVPKLSFIKNNQSSAITSFLSTTNYTAAYKDYVDTLIDTTLNKVTPQFYTRIGHPLLPAINKMIRRVNEHGFITKWFSNKNATFFTSSFEKQIQITIKHLQSVFLCLFVGLFFGFAILIVENCLYCSKNKQTIVAFDEHA